MTYEAERDEEQEEYVLWAEEDGERVELTRAPLLSIVRQADFDQDGISDVFVSTSQGGNCCPEEYAIYSYKDGKVRTAGFAPAWASYTVVQRNQGLAVQQKTSEETSVFLYRDDGFIAVETIPKLPAVKEIHGLGQGYEGEQQYQVLEVDINDDGTIETIRCDHWPRWGSMLCSLPLPNGEKQEMSLGCDRIGLLEAKSNGYHQLACNNDTLFVFDGHIWVVSDVPTERLAEHIQALESVIGVYPPPRLADDAARTAVIAKYEDVKSALDSGLAQVGDEKHLRELHLLFLRGTLQAMGHNLDYRGAWQEATNDLRAVLTKVPHHIPSLLTLARLRVNSRPDLASEAEGLFRAAQCAHGNNPLAEAQAGLFFAFYYQGKMSDALRQGHLLVTVWPQQPEYQRLFDTARVVVERASSDEEVQDILASPVESGGCSK